MCHGMTAEKFISHSGHRQLAWKNGERERKKETKCARKRESVKSMKKFDL